MRIPRPNRTAVRVLHRSSGLSGPSHCTRRARGKAPLTDLTEGDGSLPLDHDCAENLVPVKETVGEEGGGIHQANK